MWYKKYLQVYNKSIDEIPDEVFHEIKHKIASLQDKNPLASVVLIGYNEEERLLSALWSLSETKTNYPIEIIGIDNNSDDRTAEVYQRCGIPYFTESRKGCGWARRCGIYHAKGKYHINIDSDTMYPPRYIDTMIHKLEDPGIVAVSSSWGYYSDEQHPAWFLRFYESVRDIHLWLLHFKRPELSVRGLVFAYRTDLARKEGVRTDIIRGEDGSLALSLKPYGKIAFIRSKKARAITGFGTLSADGSIWNAFFVRLKNNLLGGIPYLNKKGNYEDKKENILDHNS